MLRFLLQLKRRIQRLLKVKSATRLSYVLSTRARVTRIILLTTVAVLVVLLYPTEDLFDPFDTPRKGDVAREDIIAPFPITLLKSTEILKTDKETATQSVPLIIDYDSVIVREAIGHMQSYFSMVDSLMTVESNPSPGRLDEFYAALSNEYPLLSETTINRTLTLIDSLPEVIKHLENIYLNEIYRVGFLENLATLPSSRIRTVLIMRGETETPFPFDRLMDKAVVYGRLLTSLNHLAATDSIDVDYYYHVAKNFLRPNLKLGQEAYTARVSESVDLVSAVSERVEEGDIIIHGGQKIFKRHEEILKEMARVQRAEAVGEWGLATYMPFVGRVILIMLLFSSLYLFLYYFRRDLFSSNPRLLALLLVFIVQLFMIYLVEYATDSANIQSIYIYPVALLPIMVTILFDAEIAILSTVVMALLLGVTYRFSFLITFLTVAVGIATALSSQSVRKRSDYYRITLVTVVTYLVFVFAIENLRMAPSEDIMSDLFYGALVGFATTPLVVFLIPVFESLFGFTTDITLLELSDLNHPLLKRLALEAPGTYHHSISVGNLSESAAESIGANSLLARVGTYYHDIGKIEIPEYFVENQLSVTSRHESLTPSMSSMILSSHVKKGRLLGEEAGIPDEVLNFIEEHHGTMVMGYFYNKALEQGEDVSAVDKFRYPGPKPQTRETGISMLADAVEAASRTLDDPKPARIAALIQKIINDRFESGELDECPLTLKDLARIKIAFAAVLMAAFHHRVEYPDKDK